MATITTTPCAIDLKKQLETDWENSMRASIQQSLLARMKQDDEKRDSILHVSNWKNSAAFKALRENKAREQEEAKQGQK